MSEPIAKGSCLCKNISYTIVGEPQRIVQCFCEHCRKNGGYFCQLTSKFLKEQFTVEDPKGLIKKCVLTGTTSGNDKHKFFCSECGVTIYTANANDDTTVVVRPAGFDEGAERFKPTLTLFGQNRTEHVKSCLEFE